MLKRGHDLHALSFFVLYMYTIFAQIGYAYFPELSELIGAYFGPKLFYKYWAFMFLSFVLTFLFYLNITKNESTRPLYILKKTKSYGCLIFFSICVFLYVSLSFYFVLNRSLFGYGGGTPMGSPLFGIGFWMYTICTFVLYTLLRDNKSSLSLRLLSLLFFLFCIEFFLRVAIASGVRSTILYFFVSIFFFEVFPLIQTIKKNRQKLFILTLSSIIVFTALSVLRTLRTQGQQINFSSFSTYDANDSKFTDQGLPAIVLMQDYYNPSHTLFVSMQYSFIDPLKVLQSNLANSLVKMDYPYLSNMIVQKVTGATDSRGAGWAYHYFVEGYNAMGFLGIFYNAIFWNLGMILWTRLARSNDPSHNKSVLAICSLIVTLVMRSQNSAFIQFYWLLLIPSLLFLVLANSSKIFITKKV